MTKAEVLNIFVHMPKTAGERIKRNIQASLPKDSFIHASYSYFVEYYDIKGKAMAFYRGKDHFCEYMNSLNDREKEKITCIGGHDSYYGIHKLFKATPRYWMFVRDPLARTLSLYNYERTIYQNYNHYTNPLNVRQLHAYERIKDNFFINGKVPSFEEWLNETYDRKNPFYYSMTKNLKHLGFITDDNSERSILEGLKQFYFLGITERYDEDALFMYHQLNIKKMDADAHASTLYVTLKDLDSSLVRKINEKNERDIFLYQQAILENERFRTSKYYYLSVNEMKTQMRFYLLKLALYGRFKAIFNRFWLPIKSKLKTYRICIYIKKKINKKCIDAD